MSTVTEIAAEIARRKQELAELEQKLEAAKAEAEPENIQLARKLHSLLCQWNHTDGCGWFYEFKDKQEDWTGHAHAEYLGKARKLMHRCKEKSIGYQFAIEVYKMVKE